MSPYHLFTYLDTFDQLGEDTATSGLSNSIHHFRYVVLFHGFKNRLEGIRWGHKRSEVALTLKSSSNFLPFFLRFPLSPSRSTSSAIPRANGFSDAGFGVGDRWDLPSIYKSSIPPRSV